MIWKQRAHLFLRLIVKFIRGEFHAVLIFDGMVRLDAQKNMVHLAVCTLNIVAIVRNHQWNSGILRQTNQRRIDQFCSPNSVIL